MKYILVFTILATSLFANYNFKENNSGKIDMHGGKSSSLMDKSSNLSEFKTIKPLGKIKIDDVKNPKNPKLPTKPKKLIKK